MTFRTIHKVESLVLDADDGLKAIHDPESEFVIHMQQIGCGIGLTLRQAHIFHQWLDAVFDAEDLADKEKLTRQNPSTLPHSTTGPRPHGNTGTRTTRNACTWNARKHRAS